MHMQRMAASRPTALATSASICEIYALEANANVASAAAYAERQLELVPSDFVMSTPFKECARHATFR